MKTKEELEKMSIAALIGTTYQCGLYWKAPALCFPYLWDTDLVSSLTDESGVVELSDLLMTLAVEIKKDVQNIDNNGDIHTYTAVYYFSDGSYIAEVGGMWDESKPDGSCWDGCRIID